MLGVQFYIIIRKEMGLDSKMGTSNLNPRYIVQKIDISNENKIIWLNGLINKIFKILPIVETNGMDLSRVYINALIYEIASANDIFFNGELTELIPKLNILMKEDLLHSEIRKLIFECTSLVEKIKKNFEDV